GLGPSRHTIDHINTSDVDKVPVLQAGSTCGICSTACSTAAIRGTGSPGRPKAGLARTKAYCIFANFRLGAAGFRAKRDKTYRDEVHGDLTSEIGGWEL
ncbi:MAG: hypothetical protein VX624_01390, partial [Pseudomonadota bacterium]|nr:hypothetical protein [Pseudomonadota bacterium]